MVQVKFKNSLCLLKDEYALVNAVADSVKEQLKGVDMETLKYSAQLVKDVCTCIENSVHQKFGKKRVDKKNIVLKVFSVLYPDKIDLNVVDEMVEFAHENNMIHKRTWLRKLGKVLKFFLLR
jgi:hypothetical protein